MRSPRSSSDAQQLAGIASNTKTTHKASAHPAARAAEAKATASAVPAVAASIQSSSADTLVAHTEEPTSSDATGIVYRRVSVDCEDAEEASHT